jgi:hypothetical protein
MTLDALPHLVGKEFQGLAETIGRSGGLWHGGTSSGQRL